MNPNKYFLPYQLRWLNDKSKIKIWEKSRRIGATYVQSYEDVKDCISNKVPEVLFSSADESAAREYIEYCEKWTKLFAQSAKFLGQVVIDSENDIKAYVIEFANGTKIHALSSNPKAFRSKGGKVVLDEFAHHNNSDILWTAATPCKTWNPSLRILSTHNGQKGMFYKFIDEIKKSRMLITNDNEEKKKPNPFAKWSLHTTPIQLAVEEGLLDKIYKRPTTEEERQEWLEELRIDCFNEFTWQQEYCCVAVDEATSFLPYNMITSCELDDVIKPLEEITGNMYVGMDIGRKHDLTVIWVLEQLGNVKYTRMFRVLDKEDYDVQEGVLYKILKHKKLRRCCIDSTGLGGQLAERAAKKFGKHRVEEINFNPKVKEDLAYGLRINFEKKTIYIPSDPDVREDLHSVKRATTAANNIRFDVDKSDATGHADRFWALALALHAEGTYKGPIHVATRRRRESISMTKGLYEKIDFNSFE